jgi:hypothetical protein
MTCSPTREAGGLDLAPDPILKFIVPPTRRWKMATVYVESSTDTFDNLMDKALQ